MHFKHLKQVYNKQIRGKCYELEKLLQECFLNTKLKLIYFRNVLKILIQNLNKNINVIDLYLTS